MKISLGTFVKEAPECRADLIKHLQAFNRSSTSIADSRSPATKRAAEPTDDPHPTVRPFAPHRAPPVDTGPTPMETALESEACYHADQSTHVNAVSVVKCVLHHVFSVSRLWRRVDNGRGLCGRPGSPRNAYSSSSRISNKYHHHSPPESITGDHDWTQPHARYTGSPVRRAAVGRSFLPG
ncbi:hypothetical protein WJX79_005319 [Trebouxia sp. C0005]